MLVDRLTTRMDEEIIYRTPSFPTSTVTSFVLSILVLYFFTREDTLVGEEGC